MNPDPNPQIVCFTEFQLSSEYAGQLVIRPVQRFRSICKIFNLHLYVTKFPGFFWWKLFIWFFMRICNSLNSGIEWKKIANEEYVNFVLKSNFFADMESPHMDPAMAMVHHQQVMPYQMSRRSLTKIFNRTSGFERGWKETSRPFHPKSS